MTRFQYIFLITYLSFNLFVIKYQIYKDKDNL